MKILAFSDLHCDTAQAAKLVEASAEADVVIGAGDFASVHDGLQTTIDALSGIERPTVLVPGNNERLDDLRAACLNWPAAMVLHGDMAEIDGTEFFGLGAGIPVTPWDWSYDMSDEEAEPILAKVPQGSILVLHSPPRGHCDQSSQGESLGSPAIAAAIEARQPQLAVFGHIHEAWGDRSRIGETELANLGPSGTWFEV